MTRRRRYGRRRSRGGGFSVGRIAKYAAIGVLAGMVAPRVLPQVDSKLVGAGAAFMTGGGALGAAAAYFAPTLLGGVLGSGSTNNSW